MLVKNLGAPAKRLMPYLVRKNFPAGAIADLDLTDPGMAGCLDGVNAAGLAISCNHRAYPQLGASRIPPSLLCKEILEQCEDVDQALQKVKTWPPTKPSLLLLMDRKGMIASVDISERIEVQRPKGLAIHTNHGQTIDPPWPWWRPLLPGPLGYNERPSSGQRRNRMAALLQNQHITVQDLKQALADHDSEPGDLSICRHGSYLSTRCSVILYPGQSSMEILKGAPCKGTYTRIEGEVPQRATRFA